MPAPVVAKLAEVAPGIKLRLAPYGNDLPETGVVSGTTAMVLGRITDPPDMPGCTVRVSVFRQGVSFWFDRDRGADDNHFDWGHPIQF